MAESTPPPGQGNDPIKVKKATQSTVPKADSDFGTTGTDVNTSWKANPHITVAYITQPQFETKVLLYNSTLEERIDTGSDRPTLTSDLKEIDQKLDEGMGWIKGYLIGQFNKTATAHYAKFGMVKVGGGYELPRDRDKRKLALKLILPALTEYGYGANDYGTAYFTPLITKFNAQMGSAKTTDSGVSGLVSDKNQLKKDLTKVLKSLVLILEGNYPDTYKGVLREWGFQKEKY